MSDNITITVDRDGLTRGHQISINLVKTDGSGHGYRISGPKFNGSSTSIIKHTLTKRDAGEIRYYLNRIFPEAELTRLREEIEQYREAARGQVVIVNTASSRIKELEAEVGELREALEAAHIFAIAEKDMRGEVDGLSYPPPFQAGPLLATIAAALKESSHD